jgi:di/tricarboxylate transporter
MPFTTAMTWEHLLIFVVMAALVLVLYREWVSPLMAFFGAAAVFTLSGVLSPREMLSGFANVQIAVIMLLLVMSGLIRKTALVGVLFARIFQTRYTYRGFLLRLMGYTAVLSAFLNNTPIVATLIPYVYDWGRKKNIAPSKLLIPLSYAAILGGTATLIGTSTNLIVNGLVVQSGRPGLGLFDFSLVGLPLIVGGIVYLAVLGYTILPNRQDVLARFTSQMREYMVETRLQPGSPLAGRSVEEAGLRNLKGLYLVEIIRETESIYPVAPDVILHQDDRLLFAGAVSTVADLLDLNLGLEFSQQEHMQHNPRTQLVESVIPSNSPLVGYTAKGFDFRSRYDAAIVAVHRNGEKISGKLGETELKAGDLLLLLAGPDFEHRVNGSQSLYKVSNLREYHQLDVRSTTLIVGGLVAAVGLAATGLVSLFKALLGVLTLQLLTGVATIGEVRKALDLRLFGIAAFALAMGKAVDKTGAAALVADGLLAVAHSLGPVVVLGLLYLLTNVLTEFMTNVAAASVILPIGLETAQALGVPEATPFILAVAYGASASFITPFGYQTNLMVLGPGNYRFKDFLRVGFPLSLLYMLTAVGLLGYLYQLY